MRIATISALWIFLMAGGLAAQNTPPGGDQVGSDRHVGEGGLAARPTNDPEANQRVTSTTGSVTGDEGSPAFAGSGYDARTSTENPAVAGEAKATGTHAASRAGAGMEERSGMKAGDDGSVWQSQTTRQSNVVARESGRGPAKASRKKRR